MRNNGVGWASIGEAIGTMKGRVVVLFDACHSGHLTQELVVPNNAVADALASESRSGSFVFAEAKGRQFSFEPSGGPRGLVLDTASAPLVNGTSPEAHGFFTGTVLASLASRETDTNRDGVLQLSELVDSVTDRVTRASHGQQTPWVARREIFGDLGIASTR